MIIVKCQDSFSQKNKQNLECHLLQILFGALRAKLEEHMHLANVVNAL